MQRRILLLKDLSLTRDLSGEKVSHIYTWWRCCGREELKTASSCVAISILTLCQSLCNCVALGNRQSEK